MSKVASYRTVGVVSLLAGGLAVWLVGCTPNREKVDEANTVVSRDIAVEGMHCQGCADSITAALTAIPGVQAARVSFADKQAVVLAKESEVPTEKILAAITAAGYQAHTEKPIMMHPIGLVHSPYKEIKGTPIQGVFGEEAEAWVELNDKYTKGLKDLDGFSHAILLYQFHLSDKEEIGKPYLEDQEHGIFAMRSPHRPNHIGLSIVKIKKIEGGRLYFTEVDILDGTPLLDIKPYVKQFDSRPDAVSGWIDGHFKDGKLPARTTAK